MPKLKACVKNVSLTSLSQSSMQFKGKIQSRLPEAGTSIFAVMSGLAAETGAINLSQGFPDFEISNSLIQLVTANMQKGYNQYAPMQGVLALREAIASKAFKIYGIKYDPVTEINVTAGATEAIFSVITAMVHAGDEVIIIEPAYDSYVPSVKLCGGIVKYSSLSLPGYQVNWDEIRSLISSRTRMIILNTPHNPTGSVLQKSDLLKLNELVSNTNILILSDEVYEHLIFDGLRHESICYYPELAERSFVIGSFGKTFHTTGWKTGYILAPSELMTEVRKVHQFVVFASNTPIQYAIAEFLHDETNYLQLPNFYQQKRDLFVSLISESRFKVIPSFGTYFQLLDYSAISDSDEMSFAIRLTKEFGVASVPVSPFYHNATDNKVLRFCFAKKEETLRKAAAILCSV